MEGDVLDALQQLGYGGPLREEAALLAAAAGGLCSAEYVELCRWLAARLQLLCGLEDSITSGPGDVGGLQVEVSALLTALHCPCEEVVSGILKGVACTTKDHLQVVLFLSSELQAERILSGGGARQRDESPAHRELRLIREALRLPEPSGRDAAGLLAQVQDQVEEVLRGLPSGFIGNPVLRKPLSSDQWEALLHLNAALSEEYECRRKMLIKRLDVTIQSFGWSDRAKVQVDSMARAYQPRRHSLRPRPSVDTAVLLAAREELCNVVKTSSGCSRENTSCAVNKILMGRVPDRGGRPADMEAPRPEMPPWQARQDGGGGGRGGGGSWRGGGGWRGGGHGRRGRN